jgi:hypothetical protein
MNQKKKEKEEKKEVAKVSNDSLLLDTDKFEHGWRVGTMLSQSTMVPEHFRQNVGNCVIALNYADRAGIDPFMAMQKMYVIHGKPAVETQLQIALFNKCGKFTPLKYKMGGDGDTRMCVAYSTEKESGETIEGPPVSIKMAKDEGWYDKKGSKWKTLPELMLRYRAAAFFIRLYAPETTLGLQTHEEVIDTDDIIDITPVEETVIEEVKKKANKKKIDIEPEQEQKPEPEPEEMTEEEKQQIMKEEAEQAEGPDF